MAAAAELMMTMLLLARGGNARQGKASPLSITGGGGVPSSRLERKRERRSESRRGEGDPDTGRLSVSMKGGAPKATCSSLPLTLLLAAYSSGFFWKTGRIEHLSFLFLFLIHIF